jgi:hypothetical protein
MLNNFEGMDEDYIGKIEKELGIATKKGNT